MQWGAASGSGEIRITLPVSFTSPLGGLATPRASAAWAVITASISTNTLQINSPSAVYWLCWGKQQQWGSLVLNTYNKSVILPVSTTAANYAVTIITNFTAGTGNGAWGSVALISRSTTQFVCNKDFGETDKTAYWILVGY